MSDNYVPYVAAGTTVPVRGVLALYGPDKKLQNTKEPLKCEFCGQRFSKPAGAVRHVKAKHKNENTPVVEEYPKRLDHMRVIKDVQKLFSLNLELEKENKRLRGENAELRSLLHKIKTALKED